MALLEIKAKRKPPTVQVGGKKAVDGKNPTVQVRGEKTGNSKKNRPCRSEAKGQKRKRPTVLP